MFGVGMKVIDLEFIEYAIVGATLLACGGGGDPKIGYLMAKQAIETYGNVQLISSDMLSDSDILGAVSMMGIGSVTSEKFPSGQEFEAVIRALGDHVGMHANVLYPIETGAMNSMIPIVAAAMMGLKLVDADCAGRAFPELNMISQSIVDIFNSPVALVNEKLDPILVSAKSFVDMETYCHAITMAFGGIAIMAESFVTKEVFETFAIQNSLSRAYEIGKIIKTSKTPIEDLINQQGVYYLFEGIIETISTQTEDGFTKSVIDFVSMAKDKSYQIIVQNENLSAYKNDQLLAIVPDLICILDLETSRPMINDHLYEGLHVCVIALKCDPKWRTDKGLSIAGPSAFNMKVAYQSLEDIWGV